MPKKKIKILCKTHNLYHATNEDCVICKNDPTEEFEVNIGLYTCFRENCGEDCGKGFWTAELNSNQIGDPVFKKLGIKDKYTTLVQGCGKTPTEAIIDLMKQMAR